MLIILFIISLLFSLFLSSITLMGIYWNFIQAGNYRGKVWTSIFLSFSIISWCITILLKGVV